MNWSRNTLRLKEVLKELGFSEITKAMVLNTMGRMTTIPQGARLKGIPMETVLTAFGIRASRWNRHAPNG